MFLSIQELLNGNNGGKDKDPPMKVLLIGEVRCSESSLYGYVWYTEWGLRQDL